ncbi:hypothetical protein HPP92_029149 [Vanilla planifolia]|uniref:Uncharacterized protein n=1 Tax=Vanilla planifolia TaxID=51239 RepID=A0A835P5U7_VANPL|nr:hypothetical protein HPP92_029149 [Vanilla planifolia]KAG0445827.1 hypothetical protein HPP92_029138 [Vanilla planifolia]
MGRRGTPDPVEVSRNAVKLPGCRRLGRWPTIESNQPTGPFPGLLSGEILGHSYRWLRCGTLSVSPSSTVPACFLLADVLVVSFQRQSKTDHGALYKTRNKGDTFNLNKPNKKKTEGSLDCPSSPTVDN